MGNTRSIVSLSASYSVHPHTHGEHLILGERRGSVDGSSPHAWGTPGAGEGEGGGDRFIPTRMGNTPGQLAGDNDPSVHPHTHGEHLRPQTVNSPDGGSSPHAWGTLRLRYCPCGHLRFIPTRMGNTSDYSGLNLHLTVHPHTHGEHCDAPRVQGCDDGSSPHAWGTH